MVSGVEIRANHPVAFLGDSVVHLAVVAKAVIQVEEVSCFDRKVRLSSVV